MDMKPERRRTHRRLATAPLLVILALAASTVGAATGATKPPLKEQMQATAAQCGTSSIKIAIVQPAGNSYGEAITKGINVFPLAVQERQHDAVRHRLRLPKDVQYLSEHHGPEVVPGHPVSAARRRRGRPGRGGRDQGRHPGC